MKGPLEPPTPSTSTPTSLDDSSITNDKEGKPSFEGRLGLIVNPKSGSSERLGDLLLALVGHSIEVHITRDPAQVVEMSKSAATGSIDRLLIAGGDGTLSMVVEALVPEYPEIELAVVPLGTGNDFARCLGLEADNLELAARAALETPATEVDAVRCELDGRVTHYLNVANGGLGGRVAGTVDGASKELVGSLAYWLAGAAAATTPNIFDISLELDGKRIEESVIGLAVANGRYVGGGFPLAPEALIADGRLDVTILPDLPALEMLAAGTRYVFGADAEDTPAELLRARSVVLRSTPAMPFSIDGELSMVEEARFDILPRAVKFVAIPSSEALGQSRVEPTIEPVES